MITIINLDTNVILTSNGKLCDKFYTRFRGLMLKKSFNPWDCIIVKPCKMIHTFFMRYEIDAVFLDKDFKVIYLVTDLKPWSVSKYVAKANSVLEFPNGFVKLNNIKIGHKLKY